MGHVLQFAIFCLAVTCIRSTTTGSNSGSEGKSYTVNFIDKKFEDENVFIDEDKNIEIYKITDPTPAEIVKDFNTGVEAIVPEDDNVCYISPMDATQNTQPTELKSVLENAKGVSQDVEEESEEYFSIAGDPIKDSSVLGDTIGEKCGGRDAYWLIIGQQYGRVKRECSLQFVCGVQFINGRWQFICGNVLKCS
ncbi:leukocyte cell-derived chemotaxin 1-like [Ptychodera flava]|uniref:leukocyte cell-derived chemotaxin 1-like n=1 Tax=Ptychodera flava TaxID=63121 RepID=UPI003969E7B6